MTHLAHKSGFPAIEIFMQSANTGTVPQRSFGNTSVKIPAPGMGPRSSFLMTKVCTHGHEIPA
jgi:hypothetical protein